MLWFFQWSCMDVRVGLWRKLKAKELMLLNCGVGEDSWESLGLQGDPTSPFKRRSNKNKNKKKIKKIKKIFLNFKKSKKKKKKKEKKGDQSWCSLEGVMLKLKLQYSSHLMQSADYFKRPWCRERLKAAGEGDNRGWDGWMASLTRWTWVWVNSRSWWWTRRPGVLQFTGPQSVGHHWATELNWTEPRELT